MEFRIEPLSLEQAKQICGWRYGGEYSVYNYPDWDVIKKQGWAIADDKKREDQLRSVLNERDELIGHFRLSDEKGNINIGLGFAPDLCGKGLGAEFVMLIIEYAKELYPAKELILDVREFNKRAIRCYEKAGFVETGRVYRDTAIGGSVFVVMKYAPGCRKI